ncbi:hypothetical protein HYW17_03320 [Candidatus Uhrbacteria bacterium]|nr:hypothetical protein [Candidatus Uhrbacteria bacterium]
MRRFQAIIITIALGVLLVWPVFVAAQIPPTLEIRTGEEIAAVPGQAGLILPVSDPRVIVAKIIQVALGFLGVVALILILWGGYLWMTSAGNEEQIEKAKKVLIDATIGLAIILSAYGIVLFVLRALTSGLEAPPLPPPSAAAARVGGGALGSGMVESHYPTRGQRGVPRNVRILITFKDAVDPASFADTLAKDAQGNPQYFDAVDADQDGVIDTRKSVPGLTLRPDAIQIIRTADIEGSVRESDKDRYLGSAAGDADVLVSFTDLRTLVLTPVSRDNHAQRAYFGSAEEDTPYTVYLCGTASRGGNCRREGIKLLNGLPAFAGRFPDYQWSFEVGTFLDLTPPRITSVIPLPDNAGDESACASPPCRKDVPRNSIVQINFSEPILPTVASGVTAVTDQGEIKKGTYQIMRVSEPAPDNQYRFVAGRFELANQYQTAEFISQDRCAVNSCGGDVFCLPGGRQIRGEVLAATLSSQGGPTSSGGLDGIEDVAGNSLDGNGNGAAQGPGDLAETTFFSRNAENPARGDNVRWSFYTSHEILLGAPEVTLTTPTVTAGAVTPGVPLQTTLGITFNRAMAAATLNSRNLNLAGTDKLTGGFWDTWWTVGSQNLAEDLDDFPYGQTRADILNGGLWEETDYTSRIDSDVKDLFQNCYFPSGECQGDLTAATPYCCNGVAQAGPCGF